MVLTGKGVEGTAVVTATALGYSAKIYVDVFNESSDYSRHELPTFLPISYQTPPSPNYRLVGRTSTHPRNHYMIPRVEQALIAIANKFANRFRGQPGYQVLEYNDISLVFGGLFDISANWRTPHVSHRIGRNVDFSNADELPSHMRSALAEIIRKHGGTIRYEGDHWHVSF